MNPLILAALFTCTQPAKEELGSYRCGGSFSDARSRTRPDTGLTSSKNLDKSKKIGHLGEHDGSPQTSPR